MSSTDTPEAVLDRMLASWRERRAPELAEAIDRAAVRVIPSRSDMLTLPKKSVHAAWMSLASARAARDLDALLASLTVGTIDEIGARLEELKQWPADPRVAMAAARLIEAVPFQSTSSQKHWTKIFALVTSLGDFRALAVLQRVEKNPVAISGSSMLQWMTSAVSKATRALEAQFADGPPALSDAQRAWVGDAAEFSSGEAPRPIASLLPPECAPSGAVGAPVRDVALASHGATVVAVAIAPDASQIVVTAVESRGERRRLTSTVRVPDRRTRWVWKTGGGDSAVSPDGRVVMYFGTDGGVGLRSLESCDLLHFYDLRQAGEAGQAEQVRHCAWSPGGDVVALTFVWSFRARGGVQLLQLADGALRTLLEPVSHAQAQFVAAERAVFSPDGASLWVLSPMGISKVDVATAQVQARLAPPVADARFTAIAVDPTGEWMATSRNTGVIDLWRADDGAHVASMSGHAGYALALRFTPDGSGLVSGAVLGDAHSGYDPRCKVKDPTVRFWNVRAHTLSGTLELDATPVDLALSSDAGRLVVARDRDVRVYSLEGAVADGPSAALVETLPQSGFEVSALAFARDADVMVSVAHDGPTTVWNTATAQPSARWDVGVIHALAVSPDGTRYATTGGKSVTVRATRDKRPLGELKGHGKNVHAIAYSPDGATIATGSDDRSIILWNSLDYKEIQVLKGHRGRVGSLAFTADGRVLVSAGDDGAVMLWEVSTGAMCSECRVGDGVIRAMSVGDDGRVAAVAMTRGASLWDLTTATKRCDLVGHLGPVVGAAMRRDGAMAATYGDDRTVRLWRVRDGAEVARLEGWLGIPAVGANTLERWTRVSGALAFSGDGRLLGVGSGREEDGGALRLLGW